jgi:hypothetical protein
MPPGSRTTISASQHWIQLALGDTILTWKIIGSKLVVTNSWQHFLISRQRKLYWFLRSSHWVDTESWKYCLPTACGVHTAYSILIHLVACSCKLPIHYFPSEFNSWYGPQFSWQILFPWMAPLSEAGGQCHQQTAEGRVQVIIRILLCYRNRQPYVFITWSTCSIHDKAICNKWRSNLMFSAE